MKYQSFFRALGASLLCALLPLAAQAQVPAFPGALGFGAAATGGRGGTVYHVTNLNDTGAGSFRDAVSASNRIVVFDVGGYIVLHSPISVKSNLTIAGQTAPGEGIGVMGAEVSVSNSTNVIFRYFRFRDGTLDANYDPNKVNSSTNGVGMNLSTNMIFDHCSIEFAAYNSVDAVGADKITYQNSLLADPIQQQFNAHTETLGGSFTWYNNLFADAHNRQPLAKINTEFVDNVVYNFQAGYTVADTSGNFSHDLINNYFIAGPSTSSSSDDFFQMNSRQSIYSAGNELDNSVNGTLSGSPTAPSGVTPLSEPWSPVTATLPTTNAADAYASVVASAGTLPRDQVDTQAVNDLLSLGLSGHLWSSQTSTGLTNSGYGVINGGTALRDTDGDGMPDVWERQYHLDPNDPSDATLDFDGTGYTNIEKYINGIVDGTYPIGKSVILAGKFTRIGITANGKPNAGVGLDGLGGAYSAFYLNTRLTANRFTYKLGKPGVKDFVNATGQTLTLPAAKDGLLTLLATGTHGSQSDQMFTVHYADGTTGAFTQSLSDWLSPQGYTGETVALTMAYANTKTGASVTQPTYLYQYTFPLNPQKSVRSITLPANPDVAVFALNVVAAAPLVQSGTIYTLTPQNAQSQNERLDVANGSSVSGTNVDIFAANGSTAQQWKIVSAGGGFYRLTPQCATANALNVAGGSNANSANVDSATWNGADSELWKIIDLGDGYAELVPKNALSVNRALDVYAQHNTDGTNVDIYDFHNQWNQRWKLTPVVPFVKAGSTYRIVPLNATANALSVASDGSTIDIETIANVAAQQWTLSDAGGGYFRFTPASAPNNALDIESTRNSSDPTSAAWTGSTGQLWQVIDLGNGAGRIVPKLDVDAGLNGALDVYGNHTASGTPVDVYQIAAGASGGANEQWQFVRVK